MWINSQTYTGSATIHKTTVLLGRKQQHPLDLDSLTHWTPIKP